VTDLIVMTLAIGYDFVLCIVHATAHKNHCATTTLWRKVGILV